MSSPLPSTEIRTHGPLHETPTGWAQRKMATTEENHATQAQGSPAATDGGWGRAGAAADTLGMGTHIPDTCHWDTTGTACRTQC